jgi:uncharacterized membrane protein YgcG
LETKYLKKTMTTNVKARNFSARAKMIIPTLTKGMKVILWITLLSQTFIAPICGEESEGVVMRWLVRDKQAVVDLGKRQRTLTWKERRQLGNQIRRIPEDIQVLIADNVEQGFSPEDIAVELVNSWQDGGQMSNRGILILVVTEQNRIEIEFGEGLAHILDSDWTQEILFTKVIPWFRKGKYFKGLEEALKEIQKALKTSQSQAARTRFRKRKLAALAAFFGLPRISRWIQNLRNQDDIPPPPPPNYHDHWKRGRFDRRRGFHFQPNFQWRIPGGLAGPAKSPGASTVNVFYGSPIASEQSATITELGRDTADHHHPFELNEESLSHTATKSAFVRKPKTFLPMERLAALSKKSHMEGSKKDVNKKPDMHASSSRSTEKRSSSTGDNRRFGGGASWSSLQSRSKGSSRESRESSRSGGGATW